MTTIETPASADFVTWAPILQGTATETNELVRRLLHKCFDHHKACRLNGPLGEFELPSRVLSIEDDNGGISVKLVETDDLSGRYCALSHCWGPEEKRPLITTKKVFKEHLSCIPWDTLPPLFQDAITLTRGLDIKYLWIDSLCIIQDDKQDWNNEAKKMSHVYRRASLVIAAADAPDSTQRLSNAKRPDSVIFRIPYYAISGPGQDHYNISKSIRTGGPLLGPLRERGWVFQELYLGRRKIFFTSEGLRWKCGECELDERGNSTDLKLTETISWLSCLREYSKKHLTYPSDRIIALLGIVGQIGELRKDSFVLESGVWEGELVEQLLWRSLEIRDEDLPGFPSWSWAATGGEKQWAQGARGGDNAYQTVQLAESGSLRASGRLLSASTASTPLRECCVKYYQVRMHAEKGEDMSTKYALLPGYNGPTDNLPRFPIFRQDKTRQALGLAFFDRRIYHSGYFCFILAANGEFPVDYLYYIPPSPLPSIISAQGSSSRFG